MSAGSPSCEQRPVAAARRRGAPGWAGGSAARRRRRSARMAARVSRSMKAPPPVASTSGSPASRRRMTRRSPSRKSGSPKRANSSGMVRPAASSISASASRNGRPSRAASRRPMLVLPAPIRPTSTTLRPARAGIVSARQVARGMGVAARVARILERGDVARHGGGRLAHASQSTAKDGAWVGCVDASVRSAARCWSWWAALLVLGAFPPQPRTEQVQRVLPNDQFAPQRELWPRWRWTGTSRPSWRCRRPSAGRRATRWLAYAADLRDLRGFAARAGQSPEAADGGDAARPTCGRCTGRSRRGRRRGGCRRCGDSTGSWRARGCGRTTRRCCWTGRGCRRRLPKYLSEAEVDGAARGGSGRLRRRAGGAGGAGDPVCDRAAGVGAAGAAAGRRWRGTRRR